MRFTPVYNLLPDCVRSGHKAAYNLLRICGWQHPENAPTRKLPCSFVDNNMNKVDEHTIFPKFDNTCTKNDQLTSINSDGKAALEVLRGKVKKKTKDLSFGQQARANTPIDVTSALPCFYP